MMFKYIIKESERFCHRSYIKMNSAKSVYRFELVVYVRDCCLYAENHSGACRDVLDCTAKVDTGDSVYVPL